MINQKINLKIKKKKHKTGRKFTSSNLIPQRKVREILRMKQLWNQFMLVSDQVRNFHSQIDQKKSIEKNEVLNEIVKLFVEVCDSCDCKAFKQV